MGIKKAVPKSGRRFYEDNEMKAENIEINGKKRGNIYL